VAFNVLSLTSVYEIRVRATETEYDQEIDIVTNWKAYNSPSGVFTSTTEEALEAFIVEFRSQYLVAMPAGYTVQRYELREIISSGEVPLPPPGHRKLLYDDLVFIAGVAGTDKGAVAGDILPPYASVSVERRTAKVGRQNFGILRLGPVLEADQNGGKLSTGGLTRWNSASGMFNTNVVIDMGPPEEGLSPVLFHKAAYLAQDVVLNPYNFTSPIDSTDVAAELGTQKSRKQKIRQYGH
jgi:hypothetical protein